MQVQLIVNSNWSWLDARYSAMELESNPPAGLLFNSTINIQRFLDEAGSSSALPVELSNFALQYKDSKVVPYSVLKEIWNNVVREERPCFYKVLAGSTFALESPKLREKNDELKERLRKLQELADQKAYKELVKDITSEREDVIPFSTYKDQLGFGLHVIVTMFTGFLVGFAFFRSQFQHNPVLHVVGGLVGLFFGMILETTLFIVRDYQYDKARRSKKRHTVRPRSAPFESAAKKRQ